MLFNKNLLIKSTIIKTMYQIHIKPLASTETASQFEIKKEKENYLLNNELLTWDMIKTQANSFHILLNNQSYRAEILKADYDTKSFIIQINGKRFEIEAHDRFDLLLKQMGMDKHSSTKVSEVKAPMPGLILEVKVSEGQTVTKGEPLLILEAMKMENVLKSPTDGIVKNIKVKKGDNVDKNAVLIQFV
jgi:acetyl/propionyl-CoA carboxylase alpha subunit